jgi:hypothetical protein
MKGSAMQKIGFSGTREGMTPEQRDALYNLLYDFPGAELHHGDCVGSDSEAHQIALDFNFKIVLHPPSNDKLRAFCPGAIDVRDPLPYLIRNEAIVKETNFLVAAPLDDFHHSGTWYTIRKALAYGKVAYVICRDGKVEPLNPMPIINDR